MLHQTLVKNRMELLPVGNRRAERLDPTKERVVWPSCLTHLEFTREGPRWWEEMRTHKICTSAWMMRILGSNQPDKDDVLLEEHCSNQRGDKNNSSSRESRCFQMLTREMIRLLIACNNHHRIVHLASTCYSLCLIRVNFCYFH